MFSAGHPSHYVDWAVDYDYADKLTPAERAWLNEFTHEFYFSRSKPKLQNQEQTRERWRAYKAGQRDLMSRGATLGKAGHFPVERPDRATEDALVDALDARRNRNREPDSVEALSAPMPKNSTH